MDDPALPLSSLKHPSVPVAIVGLGSLAGSARNRAELAAQARALWWFHRQARFEYPGPVHNPTEPDG